MRSRHRTAIMVVLNSPPLACVCLLVNLLVFVAAFYRGGHPLVLRSSARDLWLPLSHASPRRVTTEMRSNTYRHWRVQKQQVGRIFKSTDGGEQWSACEFRVPDGRVSSLVVTADLPQQVYAGTFGQGIYKSDNGGESWSPASQGLTDQKVTTLALDPAQPQTLYAGNPTRATARPTTELMLRAFEGLTLTRLRAHDGDHLHLTPLTPVQRRILELLELSPTIYWRVAQHCSEPPRQMSEP